MKTSSTEVGYASSIFIKTVTGICLVPLFSAASIFSKSGRWSYERELGAKTREKTSELKTNFVRRQERGKEEGK